MENTTTSTVTLYKITITRGIMMSDQGTHFSLEPWGDSTAEIQGYDDGGAQYEMPEGLHVAESNGGGLMFYDKGGSYWPLETYGRTPRVKGILLRKV